MTIPSSDPDNVVQIPLSDYVKKLNVKVRERYLNKILTIGIDPVLIIGKRFEPDCLPPVESTDLLCYLVLETSFYTQKQFKAFRSLEAYNQMVSGFVCNVEGHMIANKFVVLAKVRHSQRMNDALIQIWIITEKDGTINCAHCLGCKAGLAESCSHIASVLFYLEAWTKVSGRLSCTQMKCSWILPSFANEVEYARVRDINFKSAKKMKVDLDEMIDNLTEDLELSGISKCFTESPAHKPEVPAPTQAEMESFYSKLSKCKTKPVVLSLVPPYADSYVLPSRKIPTVMNLFDQKNLVLPYNELLKICQSTNIEITKEQIDQVQKDTMAQSNGTNFFKHRAGRIGASQSKAAAHSDPALPSQSLILRICYPELHKVNTKAVRHGCRHEASAIRAFEESMKNTHVNFKVIKCGLFINQEHPWMHATPDFLCSCDCCGEGCGEIKCPLCLENCEFDSYVLKPSSCLEKNSAGEFILPNTHEYYYQVQQQLFTTKLNYNYFVVCAVNSYELKLVSQRILPDKDHWSKVFPKLQKFWRVCVLPEVLARWYTRRENLTEDGAPLASATCYCRQETEENTVKCCNPNCPIQQFHLSCLGIESIPKTWYCPKCRALPEFKRGNSKKQSANMASEAMKMKSICTCKAVAEEKDKLVKCANITCTNGTFFHLSCLGRKRMPNNSKIWLCPVCMISHAKESSNGAASKPPATHAKTNTSPTVTRVTSNTTPTVTRVTTNTTPTVTHVTTNTTPTVTRVTTNTTPTVTHVTTNTTPTVTHVTTNTTPTVTHVTTNTTPTVTHVTTNTTPTVTHVTTNTTPTVTHVTTNTTPTVTRVTTNTEATEDVTFVNTVYKNRPPRDKYEPEGKLGQYEYGLITSPNGWLDCVIIHEAHIILKRISNGLQGFQRPTLGPVRQFDIMTGAFIQIVHINTNHWVCFSSINSPPGYVDVYDSLSSPVTQELLTLAFDLTGPVFQGIRCIPVQQQNNLSDCGVFSIAFATSLVYGQNPMNVTYNVSQMRPHLLNCLKGGIMIPFPTT